MQDSGDSLDLLNDDGDGAVEMCLLEEKEKHRKTGSRNKSGCCVLFLVLSSSLIIAGWCLRQVA
jgi:hypothetical protein